MPRGGAAGLPMKIFDRERFKKLRRLLATDRPEPTQQAERIVAMQRDVVLPSKAGVFLVVLVLSVLSPAGSRRRPRGRWCWTR